MPRLAFESQTESLRRVRSALLFGLANHARVHHRGLAHLLFDNPLEILVGTPDFAEDPEVAQRMRGLRPADLPEDLSDLRVSLFDGLDRVSHVDAVRLRLLDKRHPEIAVRAALPHRVRWGRQSGGPQLGILLLGHSTPECGAVHGAISTARERSAFIIRH